MTIEDANQMLNLGHAEREIATDPSLNLWAKVKAMGTLQAAAAKPDAGTRIGFTVGDVARAAMGTGMGYAAGSIMGRMLGVDDGTLQNFKNLGMGLGTLLNLGVTMTKNSEDTDRRNAFRLGFTKAALDLGLIKEAIHGVIPITPEFVTAPLNGLLSSGAAAASTTGGLLSQLTGQDATDVDMERMQLQQRGLEEQEQKIKALRDSQAIKAVLDRRARFGR